MKMESGIIMELIKIDSPFLQTMTDNGDRF